MGGHLTEPRARRSGVRRPRWGVDMVVLESRALGHTSSAPVQTCRADLDRPHLLSSMFVSVLFQNPQPQPSDPEPLLARPCL